MSDTGGDPACWLDEVCDRCGGMREAGVEHACRVAAPRDGDGSGVPAADRQD